MCYVGFQHCQYLCSFSEVLDNIYSVSYCLLLSGFLVFINIKDTYLYILICPGHQWFCCFDIDNNHYQFVDLPFSLASALGVRRSLHKFCVFFISEVFQSSDIWTICCFKLGLQCVNHDADLEGFGMDPELREVTSDSIRMQRVTYVLPNKQ